METPADRMGEAEYLVRERAAEYRSEYLAGYVRAMTGASRQHNRIVLNLGAALHAQLRGTPCEAFVTDMRVKVVDARVYTYPDVAVVCGAGRFDDAETDTLLNPVVLFEVLSPATEAYDRGEKFAYFRRLESLREFVVVAQERVRVEHFVRAGERWPSTVLATPGTILDLPSIGCTLRLGDIYERVELGPPGDAAPTP